MSMPVEWKLKELLEQHGLSVYALAGQMGGAAGGSARRPNLYAINSPDPDKRPSRVSFELLSEVLTSLGELTGRAYTISDVLTFSPDREGIMADLAAPGEGAERFPVPPCRKRGRPPGSGRKKAPAS